MTEEVSFPWPGGLASTGEAWCELLTRMHVGVTHDRHIVPHVAECWPNGVTDDKTWSMAIRLRTFEDRKEAIDAFLPQIAGVKGLLSWSELRNHIDLKSFDITTDAMDDVSSSEVLLCALGRHLVVATPGTRTSDRPIFSATVANIGTAIMTNGSKLEFVLLNEVRGYGPTGDALQAELKAKEAHSVAYVLRHTAASGDVHTHPAGGLSLIACSRAQMASDSDWSIEAIAKRGLMAHP